MPIEQTRKERYLAHLKSALWQTQRASAFKRWGHFCGCCGGEGAVHVHHLNYRNLVDCVPDDFMPLCDRCHELVHAIPELDQMARTHGEPMHKRRMVIVRLNAARSSLAEINTASMTPMQARRAVKLQRRAERKQLEHEQKILLTKLRIKKLEQLMQPKSPAKPSTLVLKILAARYEVDASLFSDWPKDTLDRIYCGQAVPIFAKPELYESISQAGVDEVITLTKQDVEALRTNKNGFTKVTVSALGMDWDKLVAGWPSRLIGTTMPKTQYLKALVGRSIRHRQAPVMAI